MLAAALVGCGESGDLPNAQSVALKLRGQGLPIRSIETYTEENDPNKLLGRPGQYVGKANFRDRRAEDDGASDLDVSEGGSVEVFASEDEVPRPSDLELAREKRIARVNRDTTLRTDVCASDGIPG